MANNSQALMQHLLERSLVKDPGLAAKQARLIKKLNDGSNSKPPADSNGSPPPEASSGSSPSTPET